MFDNIYQPMQSVFCVVLCIYSLVTGDEGENNDPLCPMG